MRLSESSLANIDYLFLFYFSQKTDDNVFSPKQIDPTIGMKSAPSTEELMKGSSRLAKPPLKKRNSSTGESANRV